MNELAQINDITQKVRDRIQTEFVSLVPKETWDKLVKDEINWFLSESSTSYRRSDPAPLRQLIREELQTRFKKDIEQELNSMGNDGWDSNGKMLAGEGVKQMVKEIAPELWQLAIQDVVQRAIEGFRNQLVNSY